MINDKEFLAFQDGIFKMYFEKNIEFKRGKGEKVSHSTLIRLKTLNNDLNNRCSTMEINHDAVESILCERASECPASRGLRISDLRQFSLFLSAQGIHTYKIPVKYMKKVYVSFRPYIFSDAELQAITDESDNLGLGLRTQNHRKVYPVIIRILIGTGLRIGEVISLRIKDVDMKNNLLIVYESKNNVSRYVPMSESLASAVMGYFYDIAHREQPQQYLFVSPYTGTGYSYDAMKYMIKNYIN
ncbi:MAG: integrase family protein [Herbinix sp.]|jgi:integrase|nr:integrase family protein [Herbinix sp.]